MNPTKIPYCQFTWNPLTGCSPVSAGCAHCWAARMSKRLAGRAGYDADDPFKPTFHLDRLDQPLRRKKPAVIAVGFMGDIAHPGHDPIALGMVVGTMAAAWWHQFLVLTKRPENLAEFSSRMSHYPRGDRSQDPVLGWPPNVWLGVSVEDQATADERLPILLDLRGGKKWVSMEPLLGPVGLDIDIGHGVGDLAIDRLDWVVIGCESGPGHRAMNWEWVNDPQRVCRNGGVPFMLKQAYCGDQLVSLPGLGDEACDENPARDALAR